MGCLKLKYLENPSPLKVVYSANEAEQKPVQGFWAVDPLAGKFPHESPYIFVGNSPKLFVDEDGREKKRKGEPEDRPKINQVNTLSLTLHIHRHRDDVHNNTPNIDFTTRIDEEGSQDQITVAWWMWSTPDQLDVFDNLNDGVLAGGSGGMVSDDVNSPFTLGPGPTDITVTGTAGITSTGYDVYLTVEVDVIVTKIERRFLGFKWRTDYYIRDNHKAAQTHVDQLGRRKDQTKKQNTVDRSTGYFDELQSSTKKRHRQVLEKFVKKRVEEVQRNADRPNQGKLDITPSEVSARPSTLQSSDQD